MSSSQVYDRWFIVPVSMTSDPGLDEVYPKYSDKPEIEGATGMTVSSSIVENHYPALTQRFPGVSEWFVGRYYGVGDSGWQALNQVHNNQDTRTLSDHAADVAPVLDDVLPGLDRSGVNLVNDFRVNL